MPVRNIIEVIEEIREVIPTDQTEFLERLAWLEKDVSYKAPEQQHECWGKFTEIIFQFIPPPATEDWQFEVASIYTMKPEKELRETM